MQNVMGAKYWLLVIAFALVGLLLVALLVVSRTDEAQAGPGLEPAFLIIDEDSIDTGNPPNLFSDLDVNDDMPDLAQRW